MRHNINIKYHEGFIFASGKTSEEGKDVQTTYTNYTTVGITVHKSTHFNWLRYSVSLEVHCKCEKYEIQWEKNFFAVHPNVQIETKFDYTISRLLLEMDRKVS